MNIQIEHLEKQVARFKVEIDPERFERAKQIAARKLANRVRIPGFRKGKAPYRILVQNGLEPQIIGDAFEELYQDVYKEALEQSDLNPYAPGSFETFEIDPPALVYQVPLQPIVNLGDYKSVRVDYSAPETTDEQVDAALKRLQQQHALVEESTHPAALNNRVNLDIYGEFADGLEKDADSVADVPDEDAPKTDAPEDGVKEEDAPPAKGDIFTDSKDVQITLSAEDAPVLPGFSEALIGANVSDDVIFELTVPEDDEAYADIAGRKVEFRATINKIENVTLPTLNDELAARVTEDEDEPLTLLQLRMRIRENLQVSADQRIKDEYSRQVLDKMVAGATLDFPDVMIEDRIDEKIHDLEHRLSDQKISKQLYLNVMGQTEEQLREQYRPRAVESIKRALVLQEIVRENGIRVADAQVEARIDELSQQFGERANEFRSAFAMPEMRVNLAANLINERVIDFIIAIGKGEEPVIEAPVEAEAENTGGEDVVEEPETVPPTETDDHTDDQPESPEPNLEDSIDAGEAD